MEPFYPRMTLIKGDITSPEIAGKFDCIVNAANKYLYPGGGVDGAIHRAAGPELAEECQKLGGCPTGSSVITNAYNLPCKAVIHTVGPVYMLRQKNAEKDLFAKFEAEEFCKNPDAPFLLRDCYTSSLKLAKENGLRTIAFPCISTGIYGYPELEAANIAVRAVYNFLKRDSSISKVAFITFDDSQYQIYRKLLTIPFCEKGYYKPEPEPGSIQTPEPISLETKKPELKKVRRHDIEL